MTQKFNLVRGEILPEYTTTGRDAITDWKVGAMITNTTTSTDQYYNGSAWVDCGGGSGGGLATIQDSVYSVVTTVPSTTPAGRRYYADIDTDWSTESAGVWDGYGGSIMYYADGAWVREDVEVGNVFFVLDYDLFVQKGTASILEPIGVNLWKAGITYPSDADCIFGHTSYYAGVATKGAVPSSGWPWTAVVRGSLSYGIVGSGASGWHLAEESVTNKGDSGSGSVDLSSTGTAGKGTTGLQAFASGLNTLASGSLSSASGWTTTASGDQAHSEGRNTVAAGDDSHAEGLGSTTGAAATAAHAEGASSVTGQYAHSEGSSSVPGNWAHGEGRTTTAAGTSAHAEGYSSRANGEGSHAEGWYSISDASYSHAEGDSSRATLYGGHATASGTLSTSGQGSAQYQRAVLNLITANATPAVLRIAGATGITDTTKALIISANRVKRFTANIAVSGVDGLAVASYKIEGLISRAASGNVILKWSTVTTEYEDAALTTCVVAASADTANQELQITVTGIAATNLRWVGDIHFTEIIPELS